MSTQWTQRIIILGLLSSFLIFIQILSSTGVDVYVLGIRPRSAQGLVGILCAPWVHVSWGHLFGNLIGLWTLGILVLVHGRRMFFLTYLWCATLGGFMTWLMGRPNTNHVGLSGVIFGFFAFLVTSTDTQAIHSPFTIPPSSSPLTSGSPRTLSVNGSTV
jgi:membrane associated rhomboid family serine protease